MESRENKMPFSVVNLLPDEIEERIWKILSTSEAPPDVVYGSDADGSFMDKDLRSWNLANLKSTLSHMEEPILGISTPYSYFGALMTSFAWHTEDMDLMAINYVHYGAPKLWYVVPPKYGHLLESAAKRLFPEDGKKCSKFLRHKNHLVSPKTMTELGIPFQKIIQEPGQFIVQAPYLYHSGFNLGFNMAEAINFATPRWIPYGRSARPCECGLIKTRFSMVPFVKNFEPENFEAWFSNQGLEPHPEDPPEVLRDFALKMKDPEEYKTKMEKKLKIKRSSKASNAKKHWLVFQNPLLKQVKVRVNPKTKTCHQDDLHLLKLLVDVEKSPDLQQLIDSGDLIKIGIKAAH